MVFGVFKGCLIKIPLMLSHESKFDILISKNSFDII
jgi:hypothetical protein